MPVQNKILQEAFITCASLKILKNVNHVILEVYKEW